MVERKFAYKLTFPVILLLLVAMSPIASGQLEEEVQKQEWLTYEDPVLGIKIAYPSFFQVTEEQNEAIFRDPIVHPSTQRFVDIFILFLEPEIDTSEKFMRKEMNEIRKTGYEDIEVNETAPGFAGSNNSAYRVEYLEHDANEVIGDQGRYVIYFLVNEGIGYEISFYTIDKDYNRDRPIFEKMVDSFRLIS